MHRLRRYMYMHVASHCKQAIIALFCHPHPHMHPRTNLCMPKCIYSIFTLHAETQHESLSLIPRLSLCANAFPYCKRRKAGRGPGNEARYHYLSSFQPSCCTVQYSAGEEPRRESMGEPIKQCVLVSYFP